MIIHKFYHFFHPYPCGRSKNDSYLCCRRKTNKFTSYITKDKHEIKCRFCNSTKVLSSDEIRSLNDLWRWE